MRRRLLLAALAFTASPGHALWARLSVAELHQQSTLIAEGEWLGETAPAGGNPLARVGRLALTKVWQGRASAGEVRVLRPDADAPVSSTDLRFRPGDRGLWFLKAAPGNNGLFVLDHPQRFLRDDAENAAALKAWRAQLAR